MNFISTYLNTSPDVFQKIILSLGVILILTLFKILLNGIVRRKISDTKQLYRWHRGSLYMYNILMVLLVGPIWIAGIRSLTTFLGLASAGLAIAMHDTIANIAGWIFIISRKPFSIGDRIQIDKTAGDVIDIRLFQFSLIEIGNWVDADQSTGRIVHVPNSKALREPIANYQIGFEYIWNEIPVLITFESDWKRAKQLLTEIAWNKAEHLSDNAQQQIRRASEKYLIFFAKLTPIVYTSVRPSGILLTIRYLVQPRQRRSTEQDIWEATLDAFAAEKNIALAYPTTRFYNMEGAGNGDRRPSAQEQGAPANPLYHPQPPVTGKETT